MVKWTLGHVFIGECGVWGLSGLGFSCGSYGPLL